MKKLLKGSMLIFLICSSSLTQAITPQDILPDGVDSAKVINPYTGESGFARKGTVGATLNNIHSLNQLLKNTPSVENDQKIKKVMDVNIALLSSLNVVGMFDLFNIDEWIRNANEQPGRCLVGLTYLQKYPEKLTESLKMQLNKLHRETKNAYLRSQLERMTF